jgi:phenylalanyl-tRNA synthetase beta chain
MRSFKVGFFVNMYGGPQNRILGAVAVGDRTLFIELTGTDLHPLLHAASIVACDAADQGYTIQPVRIEYPYDTPLGREITVPFYFQAPQSVEISRINRLLGVELSRDEIVSALRRMGIATDSGEFGENVSIHVPPYRNDFLHPVDVLEDVMIGRGMDSFAPEMPRDFTVGRLTPVEEHRRRLRDLLVGLGFQEMIFNYLGSRRDYIDRMYPPECREEPVARAVRIANPMSENYEFLRPSVIASLVHAESVSAHAAYPHHVFAIGKVAERDESDPSGTVTRTNLGMLSADRDEDFNLVNSRVSAILFHMSQDYTLQEIQDARFISGRVAQVVAKDTETVIGLFGELHPLVLEQWGIQVPCTVGELNVEAMVR